MDNHIVNLNGGRNVNHSANSNGNTGGPVSRVTNINDLMSGERADGGVINDVSNGDHVVNGVRGNDSVADGVSNVGQLVNGDRSNGGLTNDVGSQSDGAGGEGNAVALIGHERSVNHPAVGNMPISARLARVSNTLDRSRHFYLFFERYRFILLNGQRCDRRHANRERVLVLQLQAFLREVQSYPESVLVSRSLALLRALIAIVELRIRAYSRNITDASRMASLIMDYLADVTHM
ncbi:hypothetical protein CTI12_AA109570 [Artemisia annua]|uniref:Uncharacterized protein n=1 Tax=Artemisia annua TaxID=35608 RepID=A0A2U1PQY2_ARTAN|nr:hypothetical protein CTI12_AA109570 [Artemisia annua]